MDYLLDIGASSGGLDLLEGVLDVVSALHLFLHLALEVGTPQPLHHEVLLHLQLVGVLVLVGRRLCNFLLATHAVHATLQGFFLVVDRLLQGLDPFLALALLLVNLLHEVVQSELCLHPLFLGLAALLTLLVHNAFLLLEGLVELVGLDLNGDQVLLHALDHVHVGPLEHLLEVVLFLDLAEFVVRALDEGSLPEEAVLELVLLFALVAQLLLEVFQFFLLLLDDLADGVVLDAQLPQSGAHFLLLLAARFLHSQSNREIPN